MLYMESSLDRIRKNKRESAQRARLLAKQNGTQPNCALNKLMYRFYDQMLDGGEVSLEKLKKYSMNMEGLQTYASYRKRTIDKLSKTMLIYLLNPEKFVNTILLSDIVYQPQVQIQDPIIEESPIMEEQVIINEPQIIQEQSPIQEVPIIQEIKEKQIICDIPDIEITYDLIKKYSKSEYTCKSYWSLYRAICEYNEISNSHDFMKYILTNPSEVCEKLHAKYNGTVMCYIKVISFLLNKVNELNTILPEYYRKEYRSLLNDYKMRYDVRKLVKTEGILNWSEIVDQRVNLEHSNKVKDQKYLIISLYTLIPPMRDDFGNVRIVSDESEMNEEDNYYCTKSSKFYFNHYKTLNHYGKLVYEVPNKLSLIIKDSLLQNPRPYLITKNNNTSKSPYKDGKLSQLVRKYFKCTEPITINALRHSFETYMCEYGLEFTLPEKLYINKIVGHDSNQRDYYVRSDLRSRVLYDINNPPNGSLIECISTKIGGNVI